MERGKLTVLVGGQYGSEGKGAVAAHIANQYQVHVRVGSPNAGHTIYWRGEKHVMQSIPCGWINPNAVIVIGRGALLNMKQFMKDHYRENLTLENIAASAFLSSGYASRIFKKQMNISIMDYLLQLRMDEAKKMLRETTLSIDEIASKTGYADSSYFTKVFRKAMGMTPSRYRQSLKSK